MADGPPGTLTALAVANIRYWPTVAPETRRELTRWAAPTQTPHHLAGPHGK